MKMLTNVVTVVAAIPSLVEGFVAVVLLLIGATVIVLCRRALSTFGNRNDGGRKLSNPPAPSEGV
jgi:hypothetical protein